MNSQDIPAICQRLLTKKRLTVEANRAKTEADLKMKEAQANLETARKIAEAAKVEEDRPSQGRKSKCSSGSS